MGEGSSLVAHMSAVAESRFRILVPGKYCKAASAAAVAAVTVTAAASAAVVASTAAAAAEA